MHFVFNESSTVAVRNTTTLDELKRLVDNLGGFGGGKAEVDCAIACITKWHSGFFQKKLDTSPRVGVDDDGGLIPITFDDGYRRVGYADNAGAFLFRTKAGGIFLFIRYFGDDQYGVCHLVEDGCVYPHQVNLDLI